MPTSSQRRRGMVGEQVAQHGPRRRPAVPGLRAGLPVGLQDVVTELVGHEQRRQRDQEDDRAGAETMTKMLRISVGSCLRRKRHTGASGDRIRPVRMVG